MEIKKWGCDEQPLFFMPYGNYSLIKKDIIWQIII